MPSRHDTRRMTPAWSGLGQPMPSDLDRIAEFPDIRIERQGSSVLIQWRFVGNTDPQSLVSGWTWGVERSGSPGGPFREISSGLDPSARTFRDDDLPRQRENTRRIYYRIFIDSVAGTKRVYGYRPEWDRTSEGEELHGQPWEEAGTRTAYTPGVTREIRQRIQVLVDHYGGTQALLYRKAWLEGRCPECINTLTGTQRSGLGGGVCMKCLGTSYIGGYYPPLITRFIPSDAVTQVHQQAYGTSDLKEQQRVIMTHWPIVEPDDILRKSNGEVYIVSQVEYAEFYDYPSLCIADLSQAPRTHPISLVPLPEEFITVSSGPRRQHGRAMNRESYAKSLSENSMNRAQFESLVSWTRED